MSGAEATPVAGSLTLAQFQDAFSRNEDRIHLNNAGLMPTSGFARDIIHHWASRFYEEGMHCNDAYLAAVEMSRAILAQFIGCKPGELAYFQSTAGAISQMAFGLDLKPGDEVLMWDQEYASNLYPWKEACARTGATLVLVKSGPELETSAENLLNAVTTSTRVIAISWVQFQTGAVTDLEKVTALARSKNILTVIDAIQGLGLFPFNFAELGVDAVCGGSHKWLASPVGVGFLCLREELISEVKPLIIGSGTFGTCDDATSLACKPKISADKFEAGSKQVLEIIGLSRSIQLLQGLGISNILRETERLALRLRTGLTDLGFNVHSPHGAVQQGSIVNFSGHSERVMQALRTRAISFAYRGPGVRLSPHALNTERDIDTTLDVLS